MTAPATPAPATGTLGVCASCGAGIEYGGRYWQHVGAQPRHPAVPRQDTPAPADGAPGERVSVSAAALEALRATVAASKTADRATLVPPDGGAETDGPAVVIARMAAYDVVDCARALIATAAPLPAPASAAGVGAHELVFWRTVADDLERAIVGHDCVDRAVTCLRAACDALSTAAAPVRPDREAVRSAIEAYANTYCYAVSTERRVENGHADPADADDAFICASALLQEALALVFGDSAPGEVAS